MIRMRAAPIAISFSISLSTAAIAAPQSSFVNYETPQVHPLDATPDGTRLLAVNTADNRVLVYDVQPGGIAPVAAIPVGLDPVTVRARTNDEVWVVNHISDSVSVVDLTTGNVTRTLATADEPCDVVFAGAPVRAYVSCSQANQILVFDPANPSVAPTVIDLVGEDPRALAVANDGMTVYAAIFESGNNTTVLGGGLDTNLNFPPNVVTDNAGPYNGQNPPPNSGNSFVPPIKAGLPTPPKVSLIVRKNGAGSWIDDNNGDWTSLVSGAQAQKSGRLPGWDLADHDVAIIDTQSQQVTYARHVMNLNMALAVHPTNGQITVVGTDATNEIRFEPNVNGVFLRVEIGFVNPAAPTTPTVVDLNGHLTYATPTVSQSLRDQSIGDPRGIAWNSDGSRAFVTGMGSNNVVIIDASGARAGIQPTIEVGEGPTGVVFHGGTNRVFVLNKFDASISVIDATAELEVARVPFFDPSPVAIQIGRKHLYDTHKNSGLGQISCASCHADARNDRLAWDLGDPQGSMAPVAGQNLGANVPGLNTGFKDFHPMKGPMTTQTLQDIIGKEPLHWRGDRNGLEDFNGAFQGLQGDDNDLTATEMQEFEDFLATLHLPPNPFRNFDNSLPTNLDTEQRSAGRFSPKGTPLPPGDANRGVTLYRPPNLLDTQAIACSSCHNLPTGMGTDTKLSGFGAFNPIPPGPNGEHHHMLVSQDGTTNVSMKVPQLRTQYEKTGFDTSVLLNTSGFGVLHDGSVDTIAQFISEPVFNVQTDQDIADLTALMLAFSGSELPYGGQVLEPPATSSQDAHAAVGGQTTLVDGQSPGPGQLAFIDSMIALAAAGKVDLVVKGRQSNLARGYVYAGGGVFQSDRQVETQTTAALKSAAQPGSELTFTVVPILSGTRIGVDRDLDGFFDRDELDSGSDPADPNSVPGCGTIASYGLGCTGSGGFTPLLSMSGCPAPGGTVNIDLGNALGGSQAVLLLGLGQGIVGVGGGCSLLVSPVLPISVGPLPLAGAGAGQGTLHLSALLPPTTTSATITLQAFCADPGNPVGFAATNGVQMVIP